MEIAPGRRRRMESMVTIIIKKKLLPEVMDTPLKRMFAAVLALLGSIVFAITYREESAIVVVDNHHNNNARGGGGGSSTDAVMKRLKNSSPFSCRQRGRKQRGHANEKVAAALCAIARNEEPYLDEWVDYHTAIGFDTIMLYDNSESMVLQQWARHKRHYNNPDKKLDLRLFHQPAPAGGGGGGALQEEQRQQAYSDCVHRLYKAQNYEWAAFLDIDEFLVLKKHDCVSDLLTEHLSARSGGGGGALSLNLQEFGTANQLLYAPIPVTRRFQYRLADNSSAHHDDETTAVKSIVVRLADLNFTHSFPSIGNNPPPHFPQLRTGKYQHDTNGNSFLGPKWKNNGTTDVAAIYHYHTKSRAEYKHKRHNNMDFVTNHHQDNQEQAAEDIPAAGSVFDDLAWQILKRNIPKYAVFDTLFTE